MHAHETIALPVYSLGTARTLTVHRFGKEGAGPRVYIQAGIHANELAAPLTAHHLVCLLSEAAARGEITGHITVVPMANPIGTGQYVLTRFQGRYDLAMGKNFNRGFADVAADVVERVGDAIGDDAAVNRTLVAKAIAASLDEVTATSEAGALQLQLLKLAAGAEIVLDLHTDSDAELHLYLDPDAWPGARDLAAALDAAVVMFARASGGNPFEETVAAPWVAVREAHGADAVPLPLTCVVELRGLADAHDALARQDAANLFAFLQRRGAVAGDAGPEPDFTGIAAPFEATSIVTAPVAGIIAYRRQMGEMVEKGDLIAEIVDVTQADAQAARTPVLAETSGRLFTRSLEKLARPGLPIGKIQGTEPIRPSDDYLLTD